MEVVLDSGVEQAIGTVVAEYEFEKEWNLIQVSEKGNFKAEINADKALDIDEEKLMKELNGQTFVIGTKESDTGNIITFVDTSNQQEIEVKKDAISDLRLTVMNQKIKEGIRYINIVVNYQKIQWNMV